MVYLGASGTNGEVEVEWNGTELNGTEWKEIK